jgi:putative Holliday junction resolvase
MTRRMGIDLGARFVGVAFHAEEEVPARPEATVDVKAVPSVIRAIAALAASLAVEEIVVGLPLNMNGTDGPAAKNARRTATALRRRVGLPVHLWDERLTTTQAQRSRTARGTKGREGIDAEAAAILLQSYVDARRGGSGWLDRDDP